MFTSMNIYSVMLCYFGQLYDKRDAFNFHTEISIYILQYSRNAFLLGIYLAAEAISQRLCLLSRSLLQTRKLLDQGILV